MSFVKHLECSRCGKTFSDLELHNLCLDCYSPLLVRYHLEHIKVKWKQSSLKNRPHDMWRYSEVMPVTEPEERVTLGEGWTPLLPLAQLGKNWGIPGLYVKDESLNPTGSFKARGLAVAVSMARKLGVTKVAIPSAGNAGAALAAYGAKGGLEVTIFVPKDTPQANVLETKICGARVQLVQGTMADAAQIMAERKGKEQWFDLSTLKEPYRIEGKKTMGYEIAEQLNWNLPDVIFYPTGGGTGLIGVWKAFDEMQELGWIGSKRPRLVAVQSQGCAPIVKAFKEGTTSAKPWPNPKTFASGIRVPQAIGDFLMLEALHRSEGLGIAVSDQEIFESLREIGVAEGLFFCPEGAACLAAFKKLRQAGWIDPEEIVVLFNTAVGIKYVDLLRRFEEDQLQS